MDGGGLSSRTGCSSDDDSLSDGFVERDAELESPIPRRFGNVIGVIRRSPCDLGSLFGIWTSEFEGTTSRPSSSVFIVVVGAETVLFLAITVEINDYKA
jgi:hypothetical protein